MLAFFTLVWPVMTLVDSCANMRRRRHRPRRIILVRHAESVANVDKRMYGRVPDSEITVTKRGYMQAQVAGKQIRKLIGNEGVRFFFSPYMRTRQTLMAILEAFAGNRNVDVTSEPRLREQDFGNFQDCEAMEKVYYDRLKFGRFYYRFPNGEAGTDVYDRVCDFWSTLYRSMDRPGSEQHVENFVLVTHGLLMRIFCMCYFRWTVIEFEQVWNPSNGEIWVLDKQPNGRYRLSGRLKDSMHPIKFGANKSEPLFEHMKEVLTSRRYRPGMGDELHDEMLAHLRVPGPPLVDQDLEECSISFPMDQKQPDQI